MNDFNAAVHRAIDKAIVRDHEAARAATEPAPAVSRERVAEVLREFGQEEEGGNGWVLFADNLDDFHAALLAAGVLRDEATVKAEATERAVDMVEEAADEVDHTLIPTGSYGAGEWFRGELHKLAAAIRAEDYS